MNSTFKTCIDKCIAVLMLFCVSISATAADNGGHSGADGHWDGAITLPTTALNIQIYLERGVADSWQGTIDIPVQGLRGFKLSPVKVSGAEVRFAMPNIPGDPQFDGRLAADAKTISGDFTQSGQKFPFKLERQTLAPAKSGATPSRGVPGRGLAGHWQGSLKAAPVIELRLTLEINHIASGKLEGVMISVDQGGVRIPISALAERDSDVHLEMQSIGGIFDGKFSADGSEIAGDWKQAGVTNPLVFKRLAAAPSFTRPQEPKPPFPYDTEAVVIENKAAGIKLAGTLTLPRGAGPHPAVVFLTGSGPQDRDEALMGHRPFFVLADHLTRAGIATLRCDDRGVGKSAGDFATATDTDFVEDALAQVAFLLTRKEIAPTKIGLIGHSEGGIVAPRAAVKSSDVSFIVLLAGVGVPMEELLVRQARDIVLAMGAGELAATGNAGAQRELFRIIKEEKDKAKAEASIRRVLREQTSSLTDAQRKATGITEEMIETQVKMLLSPWFRELLAYDPYATLKAVWCPVLAINGEKDLQVAASENLPAISAALTAGGNRNFKTAALPGLNHLFQKCKTGAISEYGEIEETFNPAAMEMVAGWIVETVSR